MIEEALPGFLFDFFGELLGVVWVQLVLYMVLHAFTKLGVVYAVSVNLPQISASDRRRLQIGAMAQAQLIDHFGVIFITIVLGFLVPKMLLVSVASTILHLPWIANGIFCNMSRRTVPMSYKGTSLANELTETQGKL